MKTLGNMLWFVLGGWWSGTIHMLAGALFFVTIIGAPIGLALFEYGKLMYFPFGKSIVRDSFVKGKGNVSPTVTALQTAMNIVWLPFGIFLFIGNLGLMLACFVSIIFIPFGIVIARSCKFLLWPVGAKVIKKEIEQAIHTANVLEARGFVRGPSQVNVSVNVNTTQPELSSTSSAKTDLKGEATLVAVSSDEERREN